MAPAKDSVLLNFSLPDWFPRKAIVPAIFAVTGLLCFLLSIWTASAIERFSRLGVRRALGDAGYSWADVEASGLQVILTGTAPTEAMRFRALSVAGNIVDAARLRDQMTVADQEGIAAPDFSVQILRNDDGISLIGLAPASMDRDTFVTSLDALADGDKVTDMLESTDHPAPDNWDASVAFALDALKLLPRAKIAVAPGRVNITAISDSPAQKAQFESSLRRKTPKGVEAILDISAPHPVIAPFTLRFLIDDQGARFDACSADSDQARTRILAAAADAGAVDADCTVGLGVPTPAWADAVGMGLQAMKTIGHGSITFSDADITLVADPEVSQAVFDRVVGELESNLPDVFSLRATHTPKAKGTADKGIAEFTAELTPDGRVDLAGRLTDDLSRQAVESFAKARFGSTEVHTAIRLAENLPPGWSARVLVALQALGEMNSGKIVVHAGDLAVEGVTGSQGTQANVARILSSKLGQGGKFRIAVRYDKKLDPLLGLPTPQECVSQVNDILSAKKIAFEPGSAIIDPSAKDTLDKIAAVMKNCEDYPIEVGGHTDAQGRDEMNQALSDQRAHAVIAALQDRRIITSNLKARGYGESVPIEPNNTEAGREKNRRIEFKLLGEAAIAAAAATPAQSATAVDQGADQGADQNAAGGDQPDAAGGTDLSVFDAGPEGEPSDDVGGATDATQATGADAAADPAADPATDNAAAADAAADQGAVIVQTPDKSTARPKLRPTNLKRK